MATLHAERELTGRGRSDWIVPGFKIFGVIAPRPFALVGIGVGLIVAVVLRRQGRLWNLTD
jgi:hypothetical protein